MKNKNLRILVADDMTLNQLVMKAVLDDFGFDCDIAENGKVAIEKMQSTPYNMILMDLQMPEMNGFEATVHVREKMHSHIPIIAVTADVGEANVARCKEVGMNDWIEKPVDDKLLYDKIISWVNQSDFAKMNRPHEDVSEQRLDSRCINLASLAKRTKYNPELMLEMISTYLKQMPLLIHEIKIALKKKDWNSLKEAVHKLIPSFSIMGMSTDFENMAKKVQEYARERSKVLTKLPGSKDIKGFVLHLEKICEKACEELSKEFEIIQREGLLKYK